jgi:hypothetical protein
MERKQVPIIGRFFGIFKKAACPVCDTPLSGIFSITSGQPALCANCGEYIETKGKIIRQVDPESIASRPEFAAATPWIDMLSPRVGGIAPTAANALTEMLLTKTEGVRLVEATWPTGCCVCGSTPMRTENIASDFIFTAPGTVMRQDKKVTIIAKGIPHCSAHQGGVCFERVSFVDLSRQTVVGIFFRSYAYQIRFRKLNPWKWPQW